MAKFKEARRQNGIQKQHANIQKRSEKKTIKNMKLHKVYKICTQQSIGKCTDCFSSELPQTDVQRTEHLL
jgi:hypothetical protein